jgi:predicted dehydrogenase
VTNVFDPTFAGGCLMDINYYNLYLNITLFGKPRRAEYTPNLWKNGIDTSGCLTLHYDDFVSTNVGAKDTWGVNFFQIEGEQGYIYISGGSNGLDTIRVVTKVTDETFNNQPSPDRWSYEAEALTRLLLQEDRLFFQNLLKTTQSTMEVLESARKQAGILFPCDI